MPLAKEEVERRIQEAVSFDTPVFTVYMGGREYSIFADGSIKGFHEVIDAPAGMKNDPDCCVVINNLHKLVTMGKIIGQAQMEGGEA